MAGSSLGTIFKVSTWGESHGKGIGVVIDGCPAGIELTEEYIQKDMDRRKPGSNKYGTKRQEGDRIEILSGVFNGKTTGTPISLILFNTDQRSKDYSNIADVYRPGHADMGYHKKYDNRDYRGGGRSSGRETAARVAAGAVAKKILDELNINIIAYTTKIGNIEISTKNMADIAQNPLYMPDNLAAKEASLLLDKTIQNNDSVGGIIECSVKGLPIGIGEPVFDKLDSSIAKAILSIGATKGIEFGTGFKSAELFGSENNDELYIDNGKIIKYTNHSGGILGGISDGDELIFRTAFKPTPSIAKQQRTIDIFGNKTQLTIKGRHDPIIIPRAVVVIEAMTAITIVDLLLMNMSAKIDSIKKFYR